MKSNERLNAFKSESESDGSFWALTLIAVLFILIFSTVSRAQTNPTEPTTPAAPAAETAQATTDEANLNSDKSVNSQQQQTLVVPSGALPEGNVRAALPEPGVFGPRFAPSAKFTLETTRSLSPDESTSYGGWYQLALGIADKQTDMALSLKAGYSREYSYERDDGTDGDLDNPTLGLSKTWKEGTHFQSPVFDSISVGVGTSAAASRESKRRTFIASVGPSVSASKALRKLTVGQALGYTRGFYTYDIRADGVVNSPDQFKSVTDLSYAVTSKLSLSTSFAYTYAISFQNVGRATQLSAISVDYAATEKLAFSLGVATERGTLDADGFTNSVKIFDQNVAQGIFDLIYTF